MALGLTQPLEEMSSRNIPRDKGGRCVGLTTLPPCADCLEIWKPQPPGTLWACPGLYRDCLTFYIRDIIRVEDDKVVQWTQALKISIKLIEKKLFSKSVVFAVNSGYFRAEIPH
jgi:hypothetical protein